MTAPRTARNLTRRRALVTWAALGTAFAAGLWLGVLLAVLALEVTG